jgi:hypothetical protein
MTRPAELRACLLLISVAMAIAWYRGRYDPDAADWSDAAAMLARLPEQTGGAGQLCHVTQLEIASLIA